MKIKPYEPTEAEIRAACELIRQEWTEQKLLKQELYMVVELAVVRRCGDRMRRDRHGGRD